MLFNLLEEAKNYFTGEFTNSASSTLGESSLGISKALSAIIPVGLAGILNKSTSGEEGSNDIFNMAKSAASSLSASPALAESDNIQKSSSILSSLFDSNQPGIINTISGFAEIKNSSVSSLMSMGLPAIIGLLGRHAEQNNLTASGLSGFLSSQKDRIMQAMPSGLSSIAGILGLDSLSSVAGTMGANVKQKVADTIPGIESKPGNNWLWPLIIILAVIALLWYFSRSCNQTKPSTAADTDSAMVDRSAMPTAPIAAVNESIQSKIPQWQRFKY